MGEDEEDGLNEEFEGFSSPDPTEEHRSQIQKISHNLAEDVESNWKPFIMATGFLLVVGLMLAFVNLDLSNDVFSNPEPETGIEGEITNVTLSNRYAEPVRPTISREDGIRFVNSGSYTFNLTFDREVEDFVLEPDEKKVVDVDSIIYYTAEPVNTDARMIKGGINIK